MTLDALKNLNPPTPEHLPGLLPQGNQAVVAGNAPYIAPHDLHRALEEVRRMKEFQPPQPGLFDEWLRQPWLQQLTDRLSRQFNEALQALDHFLARLQPFGKAHLPENIRDVFSGFLGFLIVMAGLYAFYILLGSLRNARESRNNRRASQLKTFEETRLVNSDHHYWLSQEAAQKGDFEDALRQLYMATLCLLDEKAIVSYQAARSNLEYLEILSNAEKFESSLLKQAFKALTARFEANRYGGWPITPNQYEESRTQYQALQKEATAHG